MRGVRFATSPGFRSNVGAALTRIVASSTDAQSKCDDSVRHCRVQLKKKMAGASVVQDDTDENFKRNARVAEKCFEADRSRMFSLFSGESTKAILVHWSAATLKAGHLQTIKGWNVRQSVGCMRSDGDHHGAIRAKAREIAVMTKIVEELRTSLRRRWET